MTQEKTFSVKGSLKTKKGMQLFSTRVKALSERSAVEKAFSTLGSRHRLKRTNITITHSEEDKK
ncbi:MAG: 50S ribosomal protein L18a [Candidatus Diapherotrites archaeon]|nr:50S ribosomal protein L18a [Candidatus Diapherotrites archaeon]